MKNFRIYHFLLLVSMVALLLAACSPATPETLPTEVSTESPANGSTESADPQNTTYLIEGQEVTLVNGVAETETAPGSASKTVTRYFGNEVEVDLNSDGQMDSAFLLTQEGGGSGTFFYVAAALQTAQGTQGTNAIFLGDRIAPQSTNVDPNNPAQFIVNYAERKPDEPMSSPPTVGVSKTFKLDGNLLVEVVNP